MKAASNSDLSWLAGISVCSPQFSKSAVPGESNLRTSLKCSELDRFRVQIRGLVLTTAKIVGADPTRSARGPLVANLAAFWQQISPIVPVLPTVPARKPCAVYNLAFEAFHGMEASF